MPIKHEDGVHGRCGHHHRLQRLELPPPTGSQRALLVSLSCTHCVPALSCFTVPYTLCTGTFWLHCPVHIVYRDQFAPIASLRQQLLSEVQRNTAKHLPRLSRHLVHRQPVVSLGQFITSNPGAGPLPARGITSWRTRVHRHLRTPRSLPPAPRRHLLALRRHSLALRRHPLALRRLPLAPRRLPLAPRRLPLAQRRHPLVLRQHLHP